MSVSFSGRITVNPSVLFRTVGDEAVLLNLKSELYLGLDATATRMWNLLRESPSIEAAYEQLLEEYDVDPSRLRSDLTEFLAKLVAQGLVEVTPRAEQVAAVGTAV